MNKRNNQNLIFVICGPSGAGKTSIKVALLATCHNLKICPSITTRPISEEAAPDIQEYHHIGQEEYHRLYRAEKLISKRVQQFGFYYGLKLGEIDDILNAGYHVLLETTLWGIGQLKRYFNNVISIFIGPPSLRAVRELRTVIMNGWHSYEMDAAVKMLRHESPFDWIE
ncbi:hypothetical protein GYA13_00800 [Candidatus Kuenenbacteria bacterium]|nr:hypothetical protein [Candidatus Kuenenbacteria bacterium]